MTDDVRTDPKWARNRKGRFHRLSLLNPDELGLAGIGGVYLLWHSGLKPEWITVGKSTDLGSDLDSLLDNDDIEYYEKRGGIFVAWSQIRPEFQDGVLRFLIDDMDLLIAPAKKPARNIKPIPVYAPGMEPNQASPATSEAITPPSG